MVNDKALINIEPPDCSEPCEDGRWPNYINAMLRDIKRYRKQVLDPEGYRDEINEIINKAKTKKIKGSAEGGRSEIKNKKQT
jgi:hypothetical protein